MTYCILIINEVVDIHHLKLHHLTLLLLTPHSSSSSLLLLTPPPHSSTEQARVTSLHIIMTYVSDE
jgi:hypothetical protein